MKFLGTLGVVLFLVSSCGRNVEELESVACNDVPVVHEIIWIMGTSGQNASVTVSLGDTVRWIWNENNMPHDVSSADPNAPADFGSEIMTGQGSVYEYTFAEETVFDYKCSVHPTTMFGTITVVKCE